MARRRDREDYYSAIPMVRMVLGYLCLIVLFGAVILLVQASIEQKKARYRIGELASNKMRLMDDLRNLNNEIRALESYERIAAIVEEELPELGSPRHPAIVIEVAGLTEMGARPMAPPAPPQPKSLLSQIRDAWRSTQARIGVWVRERLE